MHLNKKKIGNKVLVKYIGNACKIYLQCNWKFKQQPTLISSKATGYIFMLNNVNFECTIN